MIAAAEQDLTLRLAEAYRDFIRGLRMRQARIGYLLALGLVPAAISLDAFVYPELLRPIFRSRLICDAALLPCFISLFTSFGPRHIRWLSNAWLIAPMLVICWMIYASEGSDSPYYAGLNLVMLSACLLTTYAAKEAILFCALVMITYCAACLMHSWAPPRDGDGAAQVRDDERQRAVQQRLLSLRDWGHLRSFVSFQRAAAF